METTKKDSNSMDFFSKLFIYIKRKKKKYEGAYIRDVLLKSFSINITKIIGKIVLIIQTWDAVWGNHL